MSPAPVVGRQIVVYAWVTVATSLLLWPVAGTSLVYPVAAAVLGAVFLVEAHRMWKRAKGSDALTDINPMRLFHASNLYLSLLFVAVALDPLLHQPLRTQLAEWTRYRGKSPRLYPGALVWCLKKPGRDLRDKVEQWLAWKRVAREVADGTLGGDFDKNDRAELQVRVKDAEEAAKERVWGDYKFAVIADSHEPDGLKEIDLGAGHSSSGETLCGRVLSALKSVALLNESIGAGYLDRNWPPTLKEAGAWPLTSLRQSFLDGSLTRLIDPDAILRAKIVEFVTHGDFGLASGRRTDGTYERVWYHDLVAPEEVAFESGVYLLRKATAETLQRGGETPQPASEPVVPQPSPEAHPWPEPRPEPRPEPQPVLQPRTIHLTGTIPPEVWNRLGTRILPKLRTGTDLRVGVDFSVTINADLAESLVADLQQALHELGLADAVRVE